LFRMVAMQRKTRIRVLLVSAAIAGLCVVTPYRTQGAQPKHRVQSPLCVTCGKSSAACICYPPPCCCPDDYCPKPPPCVTPPCGGCCDDYCPKAPPCVIPPCGGCCDDYCPKPCPTVCWPCRWPDFYQCALPSCLPKNPLIKHLPPVGKSAPATIPWGAGRPASGPPAHPQPFHLWR
jgi:hypothetical protein